MIQASNRVGKVNKYSVSEAATGRVLQKSVIKNFAKLSRKRLCRSLIFNKVRSASLRFATLLKRDSNAGFFL